MHTYIRRSTSRISSDMQNVYNYTVCHNKIWNIHEKHVTNKCSYIYVYTHFFIIFMLNLIFVYILHMRNPRSTTYKSFHAKPNEPKILEKDSSINFIGQSQMRCQYFSELKCQISNCKAPTIFWNGNFNTTFTFRFTNLGNFTVPYKYWIFQTCWPE